MMATAARMRRRVLWAAPAMILAGAALHAGAAGLMLGGWMVLAALLPDHPACPHRRRLHPHRLFFAWALSCLMLYIGFAGIRWLNDRLISPGAESALLSLTGAAGFALAACQRALTLPVPGKIAWAAGGVMSALSFFILFSF